MKIRNITLFALLASASIGFTSCDDDYALQPQSVITESTTGGPTVKNDFDKWLDENFVNTYNIRFKYRYEEIETNFTYYTVPAEYKNSVKMAHLLKHTCLEAYDEVAGPNFTRLNFPKEFFLIGEWEYKNNGSYIRGTAEGGRTVLLAGVNHLDENSKTFYTLATTHLKTIHHEFMHIMNQSREIPNSFRFITGNSYISDGWTEYPFEEGYLTRGFISAYAQEEYTEDFAEMMSIYVTRTPEQWEKLMTTQHIFGYLLGDESRSEICLGEEEDYSTPFVEGGQIKSTVSGKENTYVMTRLVPTNRSAIESKLLMVREYMKNCWGIKLDDLRSIVLRRGNEAVSGKIDLYDLSLN